MSSYLSTCFFRSVCSQVGIRKNHLLRNGFMFYNLNDGLNHINLPLFSSQLSTTTAMAITTVSSVSASESEKLQGKEARKFVTADAESSLKSLYKTYPQLEECNNVNVVSYLEFMTTNGFRVSKAIEMFLRYPAILTNLETNLTNTLAALECIGFSENDRKKFLFRFPQLINFPRKEITKRFGFLKTYLTNDESLKAMESSIQIVVDHETVVTAKLEYLIKEVSHTTEWIVKSKALSHSLKHMKTRHEFLIRAGFFQVIPYRKMCKAEKMWNKKSSESPHGREFYFPPADIVCLKDDLFVKKCTKNQLSVNELAAFEEIFETHPDSTEEEQYDDLEEENVERLRNSTGFYSSSEENNFYF